MTRKRKSDQPGEPEPDKPDPSAAIADLAALLGEPQFADDHDAYLGDLIAGVRHYARDCLDRVEKEDKSMRRARLAKAAMDLMLGYAKLLEHQEKRRESMGRHK